MVRYLGVLASIQPTECIIPGLSSRASSSSLHVSSNAAVSSQMTTTSSGLGFDSMFLQILWADVYHPGVIVDPDVELFPLFPAIGLLGSSAGEDDRDRVPEEVGYFVFG